MASSICARLSSDGDLSSRNQVMPERPTTFEASTISLRLPRAFIQLPMIVSVEPAVSAFGGIE